jgi:hypothetical protein
MIKKDSMIQSRLLDLFILFFRVVYNSVKILLEQTQQETTHCSLYFVKEELNEGLLGQQSERLVNVEQKWTFQRSTPKRFSPSLLYLFPLCKTPQAKGNWRWLRHAAGMQATGVRTCTDSPGFISFISALAIVGQIAMSSLY